MEIIMENSKRSIRVKKLLVFSLVLAYMCMAVACSMGDRNDASGDMAGSSSHQASSDYYDNDLDDSYNDSTGNYHPNGSLTGSDNDSILDDAGNAVGDIIDDAAGGVTDITDSVLGN
jgi:hypothetical protein